MICILQQDILKGHSFQRFKNMEQDPIQCKRLIICHFDNIGISLVQDLSKQ